MYVSIPPCTTCRITHVMLDVSSQPDYLLCKVGDIEHVEYRYICKSKVKYSTLLYSTQVTYIRATCDSHYLYHHKPCHGVRGAPKLSHNNRELGWAWLGTTGQDRTRTGPGPMACSTACLCALTTNNASRSDFLFYFVSRKKKRKKR